MTESHLTDEQREEWKLLKGDFTRSPTYVDLLTGVWNVLAWYYKPSMWRGYRFPQSFIDDFTRHFDFPLNQISYIVYIALFITLLRYSFERFICKVKATADSPHPSVNVLRLAIGSLVRIETFE